MQTEKERMSAVIQQQPDDASYEEIIRELAFERMVTRGLVDSREDRTVTNKEMKQRLAAWKK